jgi:hypothetical protein
MTFRLMLTRSNAIVAKDWRTGPDRRVVQLVAGREGQGDVPGHKYIVFRCRLLSDYGCNISNILVCRISVIFRVRSAKAVKITDMDLIKRLGIILGIFVLFLLIRTLVSPPEGQQ